jgi:hypothetical protein
MANVRLGNKILIDAEGAAAATGPIKVVYVLFTPDTAADELELSETDGGSLGFYCRGATAKETLQFDFSACPLVFNNGIWVETLTTGAKALLVTTSSGG